MLAHQILGRNIRSLRLEKNLRQIDLGVQAGVTASYICEIERAKSSGVKLHTIAALAGALEATASDLLWEDLPQYAGRIRAQAPNARNKK